MLANVKIATKIGIALVALSVLTLGVCFSGLQRMGAADAEYSQLLDHEGHGVLLLARANRGALDISRQTYKALAQRDGAKTEEMLKGAEDAIAETRTLLDEARSAVPGDAAKIDAIGAALDDEAKTFASLRPRIAADEDDAQLLSDMGTQFDARAKVLREGVGALVDALDAREQAFSDAATEHYHEASWQLIGLSLGGLLLIGGAALWTVIATVTRPLGRITAAMGSVAAGELDVTPPGLGRKDEVGRLAHALEAFRDAALKARQTEAEAKAHEARAAAERKAELEALAEDFENSVKASVASAALELESSARSLSDMAERSQVQALAVAGASEETSGNVQAVAASADQMAGAIGEIRGRSRRPPASPATPPNAPPAPVPPSSSWPSRRAASARWCSSSPISRRRPICWR